VVNRFVRDEDSKDGLFNGSDFCDNTLMRFCCTRGILWLVVLLAGALAMSTVLQACATRLAGAQEGNRLVVLKKADNDREVQVRAGDVVQVELEGIGGTGYWWHVTEVDRGLLQLLSEETRALPEKKVGGPVTGAWRFKAVAPGQTTLVMQYYRVWEGRETAVDRFSIRLSID
jgi:predicted secreted protein